MSSTESSTAQDAHYDAEDFKPMTTKEGKKSLLQRLQHVYIPNGSTASFGYIVTKQWQADSSRRRTTWAIVGSTDEAELLRDNIVAGPTEGVTGTPVDGEAIILCGHAGDRITLAKPGQIIIMPFLFLMEFFWLGVETDVPLSTWMDSFIAPTIVMDFNWGYTSLQMACSCALIARYVKASKKRSSKFIMACTVSNDTTTYFGERYEQIKTQHVMTPLDTTEVSWVFHKVDEPELDQSRSHEAVEWELECVRQQNERSEPERRMRVLLIMDPESTRLLQAELIPQPIDTQALQDNTGTENMVLHRAMAYVGRVGNFSEVFVYPYTSVWILDEGMVVSASQACGVSRSRKELMFRSSVYKGTNQRPEVYCAIRKEQFQHIPAHCDMSPAHTRSLPSLLICCKFIWPGTPMAKVPVYLPEKKDYVESQLGLLVTNGIMMTDPDSSAGNEASEMSLLQARTYLTELGEITAFLLTEKMESPHSAHFLAQLLDEHSPDQELSLTSNAVVDAVVSICAVTETFYGITPVHHAVALSGDTRGDQEWYKMQLRGVGAGETWRGAIWLAVALWQRLRLDRTWRLPHAEMEENEEYLLLNDGNIKVHLATTFDWDRAFAFMQIHFAKRGLDVPSILDDTRLTAEEMLVVEKALVRAYLDKIIYVVDTNFWGFEAWHLVSGHIVGRPFASQLSQVWWEQCWKHDASPIGEEKAVIFCIHTYAMLGTDETNPNVTPIPADVTYVSFRAVQLVLEEFGKTELMPERVRETRD